MRDRKKTMAGMTLGIVLLLTAFVTPQSVKAAGIQIDGNYDEWSAVEGDGLKAAYDQNSVYIYGTYSEQYYYKKVMSITVNGSSPNAPYDSVVVTFQPETNTSFTPFNAWYAAYSGGLGEHSGSEWEISLPLSSFGTDTVNSIVVDGVNAVCLTQSGMPSEIPTEAPGDVPTEIPSDVPPQASPEVPTDIPTLSPDGVQSEVPSGNPTDTPVESPTDVPAQTPAEDPAEAPAEPPTELPTQQPSVTEIPVLGSGQYDWTQATPIYTQEKEDINQIQLLCDGSSAVIRVVENGYQGSFTQGQTKIGLTTNMGLVYKLLPALDYKTGQVMFANSPAVSGQAYRKEDGLFIYEIEVPLNELWENPNNISDVTLIWAMDEEVITSVLNPCYQPQGTTVPDYNPSSDLCIDGYYSDWTYLPAHQITWHSYNNACNNNGSIYCDGDKIYIRYGMNDLCQSQMQLGYMELKIDDKRSVGLTIQTCKNQEITYDGILYNLPEGITGGVNELNAALGVFTNDWPKTYLGPAAVTIENVTHVPGDRCEFSIDLEALAGYLGVKKEALSSASYTIYNPNIGSEGMTVAGSPTYAGMGLMIVVPIALFGAYYRKKRKVRLTK